MKHNIVDYLRLSIKYLSYKLINYLRALFDDISNIIILRKRIRNKDTCG